MPKKSYADEELLLVLQADGRPALDGLTGQAKIDAQIEWVNSWNGRRKHETPGVVHSEWWKRSKAEYEARLSAARRRFPTGGDLNDAAEPQSDMRKRLEAILRLACRASGVTTGVPTRTWAFTKFGA